MSRFVPRRHSDASRPGARHRKLSGLVGQDGVDSTAPGTASSSDLLVVAKREAFAIAAAWFVPIAPQIAREAAAILLAHDGRVT
jgi:hypothetical protein